MSTPAATPKDPWPDQATEISDELLEVRRRRYQEARAAGLSIAEASLFADSPADVGVLVRDGCNPDLIASIIL